MRHCMTMKRACCAALCDKPLCGAEYHRVAMIFRAAQRSCKSPNTQPSALDVRVSVSPCVRPRDNSRTDEPISIKLGMLVTEVTSNFGIDFG